ncbi:TetR/AcrR family transcriptional regulator [Thermoanaerobacterium butyriciformans]|uniref:AcrR family transcriptional regulator n=1 Tax=Thermoanaerobacterium butyriciformans TaxID=1702242 RepID=A0ABS4NED0_9THEO|nr:TetR/AcrR family transcriptional regulator [Thermoanaerobacterium butyriciformans]MBP2072026.1 AcrR family transcriptional regulator [Thermoanaerobacterium butyriciformans]
MKKDDISTEEKIINASIELFSEKGFDSTKTSEIAKNAGVAEGTIFRYFKTKKDILMSIVTKAIQFFSEKFIVLPLNKVLHSEKPEEEILADLLKDRYEMISKNFSIIKVIGTEALTKEKIREKLVEHIAIKTLEIGEEFYQNGIEKGIFRDLPPRTVVRSLFGSIMMLIAEQQFFPHDKKSKDVDKEISTIVEIFMNGIKSRKEQ